METDETAWMAALIEVVAVLCALLFAAVRIA